MRNLKIFISLILVLASLLSLSGCTSGKKVSDGKDALTIKDVPNEDIAATINGKEISSVVMNYYFIDYIKNMYSTWQQQYGESTATMFGFMGIDANLPLNEQYIDEAKTQTLADCYLDAALTKAKNDYALYSKATAEGFTLSEEQQTAMDSTISMMNLYAQLYGFNDADKYLQSMYGKGSSLESYTEYTKISTTANAYYTKYTNSLRYDDTAIRAYEKGKESQYEAFSNAPMANVRYLLVTYNSSNKNVASSKAASLLAEWENGEKNEESFVELVKENTNDEAIKETGGLTEDIHPKSSYDTRFLNWAIDPNRKVGDVEIVSSPEYSCYYIMYFASFDELTYRDYMIQEDMRAADTEAWFNAITQSATAEIKSTKHLNLDLTFAALIQS